MFKPKRTLLSVVEELIEGLEKGTVTLSADDPDTGKSHRAVTTDGTPAQNTRSRERGIEKGRAENT